MAATPKRKPNPGIFVPDGLSAALKTYLASRPCGEAHGLDDQGRPIEAWQLYVGLRECAPTTMKEPS